MSRAFDRDLLALYVLGALEPDEAAPIDAALARGDAETTAAVAEARRLAASIGLAAADVAPPPGARERLLARVRREGRGALPATPRAVGRGDEAPASTGWRRWAPMAIAAAVILVAGWALWNAAPSRRTDDLAVAAAEAAADPRAIRWTLRDAGDPSPASKPLGDVYFQPSRGRLVAMGTALPEPPTGRTYVLWTIRGGVATNRGALRPSAGGGAGVVVEKAPASTDTDMVAVSLESDPRTPTPTAGAVKAAAQGGS